LFLPKYIYIYIRRLDLEILIAAAQKKKKKISLFFLVLAEYMLEKTLIIGKLVSLDS